MANENEQKNIEGTITETLTSGAEIVTAVVVEVTAEVAVDAVVETATDGVVDTAIDVVTEGVGAIIGSLF
jgi:hypothetical protein